MSESPRVRPALQLNAMHGSRGTPVPFRFNRLRSDVAPLCPGLAVVVARRDEHLRIAASKRQPDSARIFGIGLVDDGRRIADPDFRFRIVVFILNQLERPPGFALVAAALHHDIDVAVIGRRILPSFGKRQQVAVLRPHDDWDTVRVVSILPGSENGDSFCLSAKTTATGNQQAGRFQRWRSPPTPLDTASRYSQLSNHKTVVRSPIS